MRNLQLCRKHDELKFYLTFMGTLFKIFFQTECLETTEEKTKGDQVNSLINKHKFYFYYKDETQGMSF